MQMLVKEGNGLAVIREGTPLDEELTVRHIMGVDWTVDVGMIFHRQRHPKTIPILVRRLRRRIASNSGAPADKKPPSSARIPDPKRAETSGLLFQ
jgi:hypothetical protein